MTMHPLEEEFARSRSSFGARMADRITAFGGSWAFVLIFLALLAAWIILNGWVLSRRDAIDPFPFILLNLLLSTLAALQAPVILMSQNRAAARDRLAAKHDYEVNVKAEREIKQLHEKLDEIREARWQELIDLQRKQLELLESLCGRPSGRTT